MNKNILISLLVIVCGCQHYSSTYSKENITCDNYEKLNNWISYSNTDKNNLLNSIRDCRGSSFQCIRFLCWSVEDDPKLRKKLLNQWLQNAVCRNSLPDLQQILPRIQDLESYDLEEKRYERYEEFISVYNSLSNNNLRHIFDGAAKDSVKDVNIPNVDAVVSPLIDDSMGMNTILISGSRSDIRQAITKTYQLNSNIGSRLRSPIALPALEKIRKGLHYNITNYDIIEELERNARTRNDILGLEYMKAKQFSVYAQVIDGLFESIPYPKDVQYKAILKMKYLIGKDCQFLRLMFYLTSEDTEQRRELLYQILCSDKSLPSLARMKQLLRIPLEQWTETEKHERIGELESVYRHITREKERRREYLYNHSDGRVYWAIYELGSNDIEQLLERFCNKPENREKIYETLLINADIINKKGLYYDRGISESIAAMLWAIEPDPKTRATLSRNLRLLREGSLARKLLDRMNTTEKQIRLSEVTGIN